MCDCRKPTDIYSAKKRILVIGDLHADWTKTKFLFRKFKLIDINNRWIAKPKDTIVVQLGDQLDGKSRSFNNDANGEFEILDFLEEIHQQASLYGGGVHSIIGNHELMNIMGNFSYVSKKDMEDSNGTHGRNELFNPGGKMACKLACNRNAILKIGNFVFAHAGIHQKHLSKKNSQQIINTINYQLFNYISGKTEINKEFQQNFTNNDSILWTREYGKLNPNCSEISSVLDKLKVGHIIIGHTPQIEGINSKCSDKIWRVDVGISQVFGDNAIEILEILDDGKPGKTNNFKPFRILK